MNNLKSSQISLQFSGQQPLSPETEVADILNHLSPSPFLFSFPHSGRNYTNSFKQSSRLNALQLRSSEDAFVDGLFTEVCQHGGNKLVALFPRAFVDVNRLPDDLDPDLFSEPLAESANIHMPLVKAGLGVIPRVVGHQQNIYHGKISLSEGQQRIDQHYHPYHQWLDLLTTSAQVTHGFSLLTDCHSMPSRFSKNQPAPDFIIGDLHGQSCHRSIPETIYNYLEQAGFSVQLNQPYAGGAITRKYQSTQLGLHAVQIEINRGLYMDENSVQKSNNFDHLQLVLNGLSQKIVQIKPEYLIPYHNPTQTAAE